MQRAKKEEQWLRTRGKYFNKQNWAGGKKAKAIVRSGWDEYTSKGREVERLAQ